MQIKQVRSFTDTDFFPEIIGLSTQDKSSFRKGEKWACVEKFYSIYSLLLSSLLPLLELSIVYLTESKLKS